VIAKRLGSRYRPGARSKDWRKIKNRVAVELTIGGFTAGAGNRASTFGALLVGRRTDGGLRFAGGVGTGFDARTLRDLSTRLRTLAADRCPFDPPPPAAVARTATWVEPSLVARVEIAEFTNDGLVRHATFTGLVE
jgi:bifunctional non-homologous end joining protein LigD